MREEPSVAEQIKEQAHREAHQCARDKITVLDFFAAHALIGIMSSNKALPVDQCAEQAYLAASMMCFQRIVENDASSFGD